MKKVGLLCLALVIALGALGVGYAHWSQTLNISGTVATGNIHPYFDCLVSNDPIVAATPSYDPSEFGWPGTPRRNKDVGNTCVAGGGTQQADMEITVDNAYPSYYSCVYFCVKNSGTVPANVYYIYLKAFGGEGLTGWTGNYHLETGVRYYVDVATQAVVPAASVADPAVYDFSFMISSLADMQQIDAVGMVVTPTPTVSLPGYVSIHMEDGCLQSQTLTNRYTFTIGVEFWNWPEGATPHP